MSQSLIRALPLSVIGDRLFAFDNAREARNQPTTDNAREARL